MNFFHPILASFALLSLFSCAKNSDGETKPFRLGIGFVPNIQFAPLYVAEKRGYFEQEKLKLTIEYSQGANLYALTSAGKLDAALSDGDALLLARQSGVASQAFFQYYKGSPVSIVALKGIEAPADLAGKSIGTPEMAGSSYLALMAFLAQNNLTNRVRVVKIGYSQMEALLTRRVDAVVCFTNNEPIKLKEMNVDIVEWAAAPDLVGAAVVADRSALTKFPELYAAFSRALSRGILSTSTNPNEALAISKEAMGATSWDPLFVEKSLLATIPFFSESGKPLPAAYQKTATLLANIDLLHDASVSSVNGALTYIDF